MRIKFVKPRERKGLRIKEKVSANDITEDLLYCGSGWEYEGEEDENVSENI